MGMHNQRKEDTWQSNNFITSIKFIPFSKYLSFHLGVVLVHANWAPLIVVFHAGIVGKAPSESRGLIWFVPLAFVNFGKFWLGVPFYIFILT